MRVLEGRFGRLVLSEVTSGERLEASADPAILLQQGLDEVVFLNATESHVVEFAVPVTVAEPPAIEIPAPPSVTRLLAFHAASDWLRGGFPAVFEDARPFPQPREPMTPRIRQLAEALAVDVLNDRFLSTERIEFMLQELLLSIVETYLARRRASSPL